MEKTKEDYPDAKKKKKKRSNFILCGKSLQLLAKIARLDLESHWDKRRWRASKEPETPKIFSKK